MSYLDKGYGNSSIQDRLEKLAKKMWQQFYPDRLEKLGNDLWQQLFDPGYIREGGQ